VLRRNIRFCYLDSKHAHNFGRSTSAQKVNLFVFGAMNVGEMWWTKLSHGLQTQTFDQAWTEPHLSCIRPALASPVHSAWRNFPKRWNFSLSFCCTGQQLLVQHLLSFNSIILCEVDADKWSTAKWRRQSCEVVCQTQTIRLYFNSKSSNVLIVSTSHSQAPAASYEAQFCSN